MPTSIAPSILAVPRWLFPTLRERSAHPVARESHRPSSRRFRLSNGGPLTSRGVRPSFFPVVPPRKSTAPLPSDPHQNEQEEVAAAASFRADSGADELLSIASYCNGFFHAQIQQALLLPHTVTPRHRPPESIHNSDHSSAPVHPVAALLAGRRATIYAQSGTSSLLGSVLQLGYSLPPSAVVIMLLD